MKVGAADNKMHWEDLQSLAHMFEERVRLSREKVAYISVASGAWKEVLWGEFYEESRVLACGLISLGVKPGDRVCMIAENRPESYTVIMATLMIGAVSSPIYHNETASGLSYIVGSVEAEIIFVNDGSTDETYAQVGALAERDPRVKCLCLSRDFGSHAAPLARLHWASGGAAVMLSVDLQDPPELVPQLVAKWQEGNYVVWAVRESRDDPC